MLAIAFLGIILVVVTFLFGLADTGTKSLSAFRTDRTIRYATDAALEQTILYLQANPSMGTTASPDCASTYTVEQGITNAAPKALASLTASSALSISCTAYPGSGEDDVEGAGFPKARDVLVTVTCNTNGTLSGRNLSTCGGGSTARVVGKARIRLDIDYAYNGTTCTTGTTISTTTSAPCPVAARARVPKIISWTVQR